MRRRLLLVLVALLVGALLLLLLANLFDRRAAREGSEQRGYPPIEPSAENGFFLLYLIAEPPEVDVFSPPALESLKEKLRESLSGELTDAAVVAELKRFIPLQKKGMKMRRHLERISGADWPGSVLHQGERIAETTKDAAALLDRYLRLVRYPLVRDFSLPQLYFPFLNITLLQDCSRFHVARCLLAAAQGRWEEGVEGLLENAAFGRRLMADARRWAIQRLGVSIGIDSLQGLALLLQDPSLPLSASRRIAQSLPPLSFETAGVENALFYSSFVLSDRLERMVRERDLRPLLRQNIGNTAYLFYSLEWYLGRGSRHHWLYPVMRLFLQKNRTLESARSYSRLLLGVASKPPWSWGAAPVAGIPSFARGAFWWLRNPIGQLGLHAFLPAPEFLLPDFIRLYALWASIDLVRLAAEARLAWREGQGLREIVRTLASERALDPFSGRKYAVQGNVIFSSGPESLPSLVRFTPTRLPPLRLDLNWDRRPGFRSAPGSRILEPGGGRRP